MAQQLDGLLVVAYLNGITVQSNLARYKGQQIAAAASMGLLTTEEPDGSFGRTWRPSAAGYLWLKELRGDLP
jgi:hypothetical protein